MAKSLINSSNSPMWPTTGRPASGRPRCWGVSPTTPIRLQWAIPARSNCSTNSTAAASVPTSRVRKRPSRPRWRRNQWAAQRQPAISSRLQNQADTMASREKLYALKKNTSITMAANPSATPTTDPATE